MPLEYLDPKNELLCTEAIQIPESESTAYLSRISFCFGQVALCVIPSWSRSEAYFGLFYAVISGPYLTYR